MFKNIKWLRLVPDKPGKGGYKTGYHSFQAQPVNDTRIVTSMHVYRGRWRRDYKSQAPSIGYFAPLTTALAPIALHVYTYPSTVDPSAQPSISLFAHLYTGAGPTQTYFDFTSFAGRNSHVGGAVPATFLNIGGRCFIADGAREGFIADDRAPAIHAQRNQNLGVGTPTIAPVQAGAFTPVGLSACGAVYIHDGSRYINTPNANSPVGTILATDTVTPFILDPLNIAVYAGSLLGLTGGFGSAQPAVNAVTSSVTPFAAAGTLSCTSGTSKVTLTGAWPTGKQYAGLAVNFNGYSFVLWTTGPSTASSTDLNGNPVVLLNTEAIITGVYDGPTVANVPYTITGCQVDMGVGNTSTLQTVNTTAGFNGYSQSTASNLVQIGLGAVLFGGVFERNLGNVNLGPHDSLGLTNATDGPTYAYAWYDPETGHMSNISPMFKVLKPVAGGMFGDYSSLTPVFRVDQGTISYPTGIDATRFSHIMFFRTLSGGASSTLYPIGSLQPFVGKVHPGSASTRGAWSPATLHGWMGLPNPYTQGPPLFGPPNYWFDFSSDEDLLLSGGFRAPQYTNEKPMVLLRGGAIEAGKVAYQAYWDRRLWVACTQEPDKIAFSCDEAQCPLGVPVESFPPTNYLRIPNVDGRVRAMKTVGDLLLITTERWAYTIVGNNESNYRLLRISTRMGGVGQYQMSEITSDVEGQSSIVYFMSRDWVIYEWIVGGSVTSISDPIQDVINDLLVSNTANFPFIRFHCTSSWARRLLIVSFSWSANAADAIFIFDLVNRVWTRHYADDGSAVIQPPGAMATLYGLPNNVEELFLAYNEDFTQCIIRSWIRDDGPVQGILNSIIKTFPLDFDGLKTRKQLLAVNAHVSADIGSTYIAGVTVNESTLLQKVMAPFPDNAYSVYGTPSLPVDSSTAKDVVALAAEFNADGSAPVGYRFAVQIVTTSTSTPTEVYAIDIGYKEWEEEGEGDP